MAKRRNYDSPFDMEDYERYDKSIILSEEQLNDIDYLDYDEPYSIENYRDNGIYLNLPTSYLLASSFTPFNADLETDPYEKYKEIEGLK